MEVKDNARLREIALSVSINHLYNASNKKDSDNFIKILYCVAKTLGGKAYVIMNDIIKNSINNKLLNATKEELVASCMSIFGKAKASKKLGITQITFKNRYGDLINLDYVNNEFLNNLKPLYTSDEAILLIDVLMIFIEKLNVPLGNENNDIADKKRTYEIEFLMLYESLFSIFTNETFTTKFIENICTYFGLDYSTICYLKNNIHVMNRSYPNARYNNRYFKQELYTLYTYKGFSKNKIGKDIFNQSVNYLYCDRAKEFCKLLDGENSWQYCETLYWHNLDVAQVRKFIKTFHKFILYEL